LPTTLHTLFLEMPGKKRASEGALGTKRGGAR